MITLPCTFQTPYSPLWKLENVSVLRTVLLAASADQKICHRDHSQPGQPRDQRYAHAFHPPRRSEDCDDRRSPHERSVRITDHTHRQARPALRVPFRAEEQMCHKDHQPDEQSAEQCDSKQIDEGAIGISKSQPCCQPQSSCRDQERRKRSAARGNLTEKSWRVTSARQRKHRPAAQV